MAGLGIERHGFRFFQGRETLQVTYDGRKAEASAWYWEPVDYEGDVLWSRPCKSEDLAVRNALLVTYGEENPDGS